MITYKICPYTYITFFPGVRCSRFKARTYNRENINRLLYCLWKITMCAVYIHYQELFMIDTLAAVQQETQIQCNTINHYILLFPADIKQKSNGSSCYTGCFSFNDTNILF